MTVTVITSVYGEYDPLTEPVEQTVDVDWVCVTDRQQHCPPWRVIVEPRPHMHPRMAAKVAKCLPWRYTDADVVIWLDASAVIVSAQFVTMCLSHCPPGGMAQWEHPERDCIYDEAVVSASMSKYAGQNLEGQCAAYRRRGFPEHAGLWAAGCIVRRKDPLHEAFGGLWLAEQLRWTYQDQISEPWVMWLTDTKPEPLPESLWANRWVVFQGHRRDDL